MKKNNIVFDDLTAIDVQKYYKEIHVQAVGDTDQGMTPKSVLLDVAAEDEDGDDEFRSSVALDGLPAKEFERYSDLLLQSRTPNGYASQSTFDKVFRTVQGNCEAVNKALGGRPPPRGATVRHSLRIRAERS